MLKCLFPTAVGNKCFPLFSQCFPLFSQCVPLFSQCVPLFTKCGPLKTVKQTWHVVIISSALPKRYEPEFLLEASHRNWCSNINCKCSLLFGQRSISQSKNIKKIYKNFIELKWEYQFVNTIQLYHVYIKYIKIFDPSYR